MSRSPLSGLRLVAAMPPPEHFGGVNFEFARVLLATLRDLGAKVHEFDTSAYYKTSYNALLDQIDGLRSFKPDAAVALPNAGYAAELIIDDGELRKNILLDILEIPTIFFWDHALVQAPRYVLPYWPVQPLYSIRGVKRLLRSLLLHPLSFHFFFDSGHISEFGRLGIAEFDQCNFALCSGVSRPFIDCGRDTSCDSTYRQRVSFFGNLYLGAEKDIRYDNEALITIRHKALAAAMSDWNLPAYQAYVDQIETLEPKVRSELRLEADESFYWRYLHDELCVVANGEPRLRKLLACGHPVTYFGGFAFPQSRTAALKAGCQLGDEHLPYGAALAAAFRQSRISIDVTNAPFINGFTSKFLECFAAGGFMLTNRKTDMRTVLGSFVDVIGFSSAEELAGKVEHYLTAERERFEVAREIRDLLCRDWSVASTLERTIPLGIERVRARASTEVVGSKRGGDHIAPFSVKFRLDWLRFLETTARVRSILGGVLVDEGPAQYVLFGPYWTLPAGHYELIASVAAEECPADGGPFLDIDVVAEEGSVVFAVHQWRLGTFQGPVPQIAVELRLPFTLDAELPAELRTIETRVYASGDGRFRVCSLAVRPKDEPGCNWFPYLAAGACGIHCDGEIKSVPGKSGWIAKTPAIRVEPGRYKVDVECVYSSVDTPRGVGDNQMALEIWSGPELVAVSICREGQSLEFDASDEFAAKGIEARFRACASVTATIRGLQVVRTSETYAFSPIPAALRLADWLPFLTKSQHCHFDRKGLTVDEGKSEFVCWGPYWLLPPGRFDVIASVVPRSANSESESSITLDVTTSGGQRPFARQVWRLDQFRRPGTSAPIELTLPFTLRADLPEALREIETRILTSGDTSFRVKALTVRAVNDETENDWFRYLIVSECGIHTGNTIDGIDRNAGCICYTPPLDVEPGLYELFLDAISNSEIGALPYIVIEVRSGSTILATESYHPSFGTENPALAFTVNDEIPSEMAVELRILIGARAAVSIRSLKVRKHSP